MRVTIVGPGALGFVYGARLATLADCKVQLVGRRAAPAEHVALERVETVDRIDWPAPPVDERAREDADVIVACVRYEQLDAFLSRALGPAPIVVMTPMMPRDFARLDGVAPGRIVPGMPGVVGYRPSSRVIRYWLPRAATTLIDDRAGTGVATQLASRLRLAGIAAKVEKDVLERNVATTVSFFPLALAIDAAGSVEAALRDEKLTALALAAAAEGRALGRRIGKPPGWAALLGRFVSPFTIRVGAKLARTRFPEAIAYVEEHFGRKLQTQNGAMARAIVDLAREQGTPSDALAALIECLTVRNSP